MTLRTLAPLVLLCLAAAARADNWPQWRGPNNNGVSQERGLPAEWSETKNVAWKAELPGRGGSTPAIYDKHIFLTAQTDKEVVLVCLAAADGAEKWRRPLGAATRKSGRGDEGNQATPSPSADARRVYAFAGTGDYAAFDHDGNELWRFNAQKRYGKFNIAFGMHSTPVLHDGRLYLQLIHSGGGFVACVDAADGKEVWKIERKSDGTDENEHSYASCFMWKDGKDAYLVCHGNDYATAHRLSDGSEIWRLGGLNAPRSDDRYNKYLRFVASPVCTPELIVVPSAKNGPVVGVKPSATGSVDAGSKFEQWRIKSGTPDVPCPLVADGLVYLGGESGGLTCLDARTGEKVYKKPTTGGRHRASPVLADGKLYLVSRDGVVTVVKAGREFEKLASNKMPDSFEASPAVADGRVYLRGFKYLWAIGGK